MARASSATLAVDGREIAVSELPETVAISPDGKRVATAGAIGGGVHIVGLDGLERVDAQVGGRPVRTIFSPDGSLVAAALSASSVALVDASGEVRTIAVVGTPDGLAFSSDGSRLFAADTAGGRVTVSDATTAGRWRSCPSVGRPPAPWCSQPAGKNLTGCATIVVHWLSPVNGAATMSVEGTCSSGGGFLRRGCGSPAGGTCVYCGESFCLDHGALLPDYYAVCQRKLCLAKFADVQAHFRWLEAHAPKNRTAMCAEGACEERMQHSCQRCHLRFCEEHLLDQPVTERRLEGAVRVVQLLCPHCANRRNLWD